MSRNTADDTRPSLLVRLRDNDEAAWREFFQIYTPVVYGYAIRRGVQPSDAEDITQEVLVEVARCVRRFEYNPDRGRFRDWLGTVVWRRLSKFWKSRQANDRTMEHNEGSGQVDSAWIDEYQAVILRQALENIKNGFSEVTWLVFLAAWTDGASAPDVASRFSVPIEVVYNSKSRVLKQLQAEVLRISDDCAWLPN
jgi:RNA polymerase sigma factor (sigma-70 family)